MIVNAPRILDTSVNKSQIYSCRLTEKDTSQVTDKTSSTLLRLDLIEISWFFSYHPQRLLMNWFISARLLYMQSSPLPLLTDIMNDEKYLGDFLSSQMGIL